MSAIARKLQQLKRPTPESNLQKLTASGMSVSDFIIREASIEDIPNLSALHVQAWNETYPAVKQKPTYAIREYQWQEQFKVNNNDWFCLVVEDPKGQLVGFARGRRYAHHDLPDYDCELNKLYLLYPYQRLGIGRRLVCQVARHFINQGLTSMVLFGSAQNPSCSFHEKLGGKRLYARNGEFHGGYGWQDLHQLVQNTKR